jgi:DNA-binding MarR family transcriptional regulator
MFFEFRQAPGADERFESALRNTAMAWQQAVERRLRRLGVNRMSWVTIVAATQARSPLTQSALADTLGVSRASMVRTVDRLVKEGLATRARSAADRRQNRIELTDAGMHFYLLKRDQVSAGLREMLAGVDFEKLGQLTEWLEQLHVRWQAPRSRPHTRPRADPLRPPARHSDF